jgi:TonB family protein
VFDADVIHRRQLLSNSAATIGSILILVASLPFFVEEPAYVLSHKRNWEYEPASNPEDEKGGIIACPLSDVVPPVIIHSINFEYHDRLRVSVGIAIFQALITTRGLVQDIKVVRSSGSKRFDELAVTSFSQWRYKPATLNGHPIPFNFTIAIHICLR